MEKIVCFEPQVQETKTVTPDKGEAVKAPAWGKRTDEPPIIQPWAKIAKTEPEARILKSRWIPPRQYELYEHLDNRWERTVW